MPLLKPQAFVKFFGEESHADQFLKGKLFMNRLRYFQRLEAKEVDDGRPDAHEGVVSWHQPDHVELKIEMPGFDPVIIGKDDLAGPIAISRNFYSDMHLFCMTALMLPDPAELKGAHDEVLAQLQAAFRVDERCLKFGPFAVVVHGNKFMKQLEPALKNLDHWFHADLVQYYDEYRFHGDFQTADVPFRKQSPFSYQNEFRVCLQTNTQGDDTFTLDIGDISSLALKTRSANLNAGLKVNLGMPSSGPETEDRR